MEAINKIVNGYTIHLDKRLGGGRNGFIYLASKMGETFAIRIIPNTFIDQSVQDLFMKELQAMYKITDTHIVNLTEIFRSKTSFYLVMEYCDGGSLGDKLKKVAKLSEKEACSILKQIAHAFVSLEEQNVAVMHRNLKPSNILFHKGSVKVANFSLTKIVEDVLNFEDYSAKCDVFSAGLIFYRMLFGEKPWSGWSENSLYSNMKKVPLRFPGNLGEKMKDLLTKMLQIREEDRPSWNEIYIESEITDPDEKDD